MIKNPTILLEGQYTSGDLEKLKIDHKIWKVVDLYKEQLDELFEINFPGAKFSSDHQEKLSNFINNKSGDNPEIKGNWIYYPWNGYLIHTVGEEDYNALRTNRNQNLISQEEQKKLVDTCVGFVGLSIGSHFAIGMAYSGIANSMKLAEFDTLSTCNLNRIKAGIKDIGAPKIELTAQQIFDINPYADLTLYPEGLNEQTLDDFLIKDKKPAVIFEAIDDFEMKIKLRIAARSARIPVIMLTNLGDSFLVDVERYDLESELPLFNGLIGDTPEEILNSEITEKEKIKYAVKIVGMEHIPTRALQSLFEINKTLVGRPQLYSTVSIAGGFAAYLVRMLVLNESLKSGRTYISFKDVCKLNIEAEKDERKTIISILEERFAV